VAVLKTLGHPDAEGAPIAGVAIVTDLPFSSYGAHEESFPPHSREITVNHTAFDDAVFRL
jgi:hypothetical protein